MTRWADTFAALSHGADTLDTMRHSADTPATVSQSVNSVTTGPAPAAPPIPAGDLALATWGEAEEHRSAIVEHDGSVPRSWAEGFARLDPDRPPGNVSLPRWRQFIDDVGRFLDSEFCAHAAALGWGSFDLFGCDRARPLARVDQMGLLWLLNGDKLVALSENTATIETRTGARQTYRRKPSEPGRVLAWELA